MITRFNIVFWILRRVNENLLFLLNYLFCSSIIHIWIFEFLYNITFLVSSKIPRQIGLAHISLWVYGVCIKRKKYMNIYLSGIALIRKVKIVLLIQVFTIKSPICNWRYWDTTGKIFLSLVSQYSKGRISTVWPSPYGNLQQKSQYSILLYASMIYWILTTYTSLNSERFCNNNSKLIGIR